MLSGRPKWTSRSREVPESSVIAWSMAGGSNANGSATNSTPGGAASTDSAWAGPRSPPTAAATTAAAEAAAVPSAGASGVWPTTGSCVSHDIGPMTRRSRPRPMLRKARTTCGSNWVPALSASSLRPYSAECAGL